MASDGKNLLKFAPFRSQVDPSFWQRLTELKLDKDKLNENVHQIWGYYSNRKPEGQNQLFSVDATSFNQSPDENRLFGVGSVINKNTMESFKSENKMDLVTREGDRLMESIKDEAIDRPSLLARFLVFTFANIKSYLYYFWFAFPAPTFFHCDTLSPATCLKDVFGRCRTDALVDECDKRLDSHNRGFFFVRLKDDTVDVLTVREALGQLNRHEDWYLGFSDTSDGPYPSWPLRNFLALVTYHCPEFVRNPLRIICLRLHFQEGHWTADDSLVLTVQVHLKSDNALSEEISWVGWEKNDKGKMGPRMASLKHCMDPLSLAETSVDLNLKLMKWQILPDLDLDTVKRSRCLLVGAGTLGCVVARNLMSWGVRRVTFVDYGTVSHSNPVRQFLYRFQDVGKSKAETAAAALKDIFPGMVSAGYSFTVPMPGHPAGESMLEETRKNVEKLEELVESHDVIFLLMDSRESRWLPTLISSARGKLVINAALGFDSYLVMRHGLKSASEEDDCGNVVGNGLIPGSKLGCYFCNDVTAPGNSLRGRTLDQQCTVTRPGVSNMAGALAVELFVSILQHPKGAAAPAETDPETTTCSSSLGIVPHSVRGFISHYHTVLPAVESFSSCVACSNKVVNRYKEEGFDFVLKALESKEYLEELCGLTELQNEALLDDVMEYSGSESED